MAIEHLALMKVREDVPAERLGAICRECEERLDRIPGVLSASMGENLHAATSEYSHALVIRLEDRKALEVFMSHPEHLGAGGLLKTAFCGFVIIDYETDRD
jgi:hypothetical protein